jgi:hypothetical protein
MSNLESPSRARKATDSDHGNTHPTSVGQSAQTISAPLLALSLDSLHKYPIQTIEYKLPSLPDLDQMHLLEWEDNVKKNAEEYLDAIPLETMCW